MARKSYQSVAEETRRVIQENLRLYPLVRNPDTLKGGCQDAALMVYQQLRQSGRDYRILKLRISRGNGLWRRGVHIVVASARRIIDPAITQYVPGTTQYVYPKNTYPLNDVVARTEDVTDSPFWSLNLV